MKYSGLDIFCHIIDNYGDIGVVYRFAREFKVAHPATNIRVFVDDVTPLAAILGQNALPHDRFTRNHIEFIHTPSLTQSAIDSMEFAEVLIEAFACRIPESIMQAALKKPRLVINLEYLSAEPWVEGYHLKPSLQADKNHTKFFYMPGLTKETGGVILDPRIERCRPRLQEARLACLNGIMRGTGLELQTLEGIRVGSIFTYARGFDTLLQELQALPHETLLLVLGEKSQRSMAQSLGRCNAAQPGPLLYETGRVKAAFLPFMAQERYDTLLCLTDFNFVRGEDSLVRAILAQQPFIWNAYIQDNTYQTVKVAALMEWMQPFFAQEDGEAFRAYRELHLAFNQAAGEDPAQVTAESYATFFQDLEKMRRATEEMNYFIARHCNLIRKISDFLDGL